MVRFENVGMRRCMRVALGTAFVITALTGRLSPGWGLELGRPAAAATARGATGTAAISATVVASAAVRARAGGTPGVRVEGARLPTYSVRGGVIDTPSARGLPPGSRFMTVDFQ